MALLSLKLGPKVIMGLMASLCILTIAFAFHGIRPVEYGTALFRSALIFGVFGGMIGFSAGLIAGRIEVQGENPRNGGENEGS